jgi:AAA+ ATPase superfamily predicted ATPase
MFDEHHFCCHFRFVELSFANRTAELKELDTAATTGGLFVVFGRRRVGKTRLLTHWLEPREGLYSQAIEGAMEIQLEQVFQDIRARLTTSLAPRSWAELFELVTLEAKGLVLCLDEFPYLVASDPSLPSVLQRWLDHAQPERHLLILSGSSTRMMNNFFLHRAAPLYGRARKLLQVRPMSYGAFCEACGLDPAEMESFTRFALVGGIPKYWEFVRPEASAVELAEELYFGFAPYLEQEPVRILRDEGLRGMNAISLLEAVGRGAERPSEIAGRLGTAQTNLSRLFQQLLDASVLERETPFGESIRSTKKTRYRIQDPVLRFWFRVYSPHRSRWRAYDHQQKRRLLSEHAATVFEDFCRQRHSDAARYWEADREFDLVRVEQPAGKAERLVVSEVKWKCLAAAERKQIEKRLKETWNRCALRSRHHEVAFEVLDAAILKQP